MTFSTGSTENWARRGGTAPLPPVPAPTAEEGAPPAPEASEAVPEDPPKEP